MATCLLCGMPMEPRWRVRDHLRPEHPCSYEVDWCFRCGYGRVAGEFTPTDVPQFYPAGYYTHAAAAAPQAAPVRFLDRLRRHLAWRVDRGQDLSPKEVASTNDHPAFCDFGCGAGEALSQFSQAGYRAVGIEPDQAARSIASRHGEVFAGTAEALPAAVEGRQFDLVLLSHVLEHCIDPVAALRNVKRLLKPAGVAIVEVPNNEALGLEVFGPAWFFSDIPRHLHFFQEGSLEKALSLAGLSVTRTFHTGYTRQFGPEWIAAQNEIRARIGEDRGHAGEQSLWLLLARSAFARPARKYDSIRVHAVHDGAGA
jgi:SAM-dependent methyltransferase